MKMLNLFEKFFKKPARAEYRLPRGSRVYAVGDIHGRADLLKNMHRLIEEDAARDPVPENVLVYLGDYIDRGVFVREVLDMLCSDVLVGFRHIFLKGNHEKLFLDFEQDPSLLELWIELGGGSTLHSYQVQVPGSGFSLERANQVRDELLQSMPKKHVDFLKNLKPFARMGDILFVHAGIRPEAALEKQEPEDLLWIREDFLSSEIDFGLRVIHGHTISRQVQELPNRVGIDTGAYATGILTCAVLEDNRIRYLSTEQEA